MENTYNPIQEGSLEENPASGIATDPDPIEGFDQKAAQSKQRYDAFHSRVKAVYDPKDNTYYAPLGQTDIDNYGEKFSKRQPVADDAYQVGDIVSDPWKKVSQTGYLQLQQDSKTGNKRWEQVQAPEEDFLAKTLEPVIIHVAGSYGKKVNPEESLKNSSEGLKQYIQLNQEYDEGGNNLVGLLDKNPGVKKRIDEKLKNSTAQIGTAEGRMKLLEGAIADEYELNKPLFDMEKYPDIDPAHFQKNYDQLNELSKEADGVQKTRKDLESRLQILKADIEKVRTPEKVQNFNKLYKQYEDLTLKLKDISAKANPLVSFMEQPAYQEVLQRMDKQQKGGALLQSAYQFFPKYTNRLNQIEEKQRDGKDHNSMAKSFAKNFISGITGLGQLAGAVSGSNGLTAFFDNMQQNADVDLATPHRATTDPVTGKYNVWNDISNVADEAAGIAAYALPENALEGAIGKGAAGSWMALSSFGHSYRQAISEGMNKKSALLYAGLIGYLNKEAFKLLPKPKIAEGFAPTRQVVEKMINPATRAEGTKILLSSFFKHLKENGLKEYGADVLHGLGGLQAINYGTALTNGIFNAATGTELPTETGTLSDFMQQAKVMGLFTLGMKSAGTMGQLDKMSQEGYRDLLLKRAAAGDLGFSLSTIDRLKQEPGTDRKWLDDMEGDITAMAGVRFPENTTPNQRVMLFKTQRAIDRLQEIRKTTDPQFHEAIDKEIQSAQKLKEKYFAQATAADKDIEKSTQPVIDHMAAIEEEIALSQPKEFGIEDAAELSTLFKDDNSKEGKLLGSAGKMLTTMGKSMPGLKVLIHTNPETYKQALVEAGGSEQNAGSEGFYLDKKGGRIHINAEEASSNAVFHEGTHPVLDMLSEGSPEAVTRLNKEMKEAAGEMGVKDEIEAFEEQYKDDPAQADKEGVVEFIAKVADGEIALDDQPVGAIEKTKRFIEDVAQKLGIDYKFEETVSAEDGIMDLSKKIATSLERGRSLKIKGQQQETGKAQLKVASEETVKGYREKYGKEFGLGEDRPVEKAFVDSERAKKIADAYEALPSDDSANPAVRKAYEQLGKEVEAQYSYLVNDLGMKFIFSENDPYHNSKEMMEDVEQNKQMRVYSGGDDHPLLGSKTKDENGLTLNEKFRAVHDFFGHAVEGNQFGKHGEERAWVAHSRMFSTEAQKALTTETRGQNSWVNFSGKNEAALAKIQEGNRLIKSGNKEKGEALLKEGQQEFQFAEQKVALLPEEFNDWTIYSKKPALKKKLTPEEQKIKEVKAFNKANPDVVPMEVDKIHTTSEGKVEVTYKQVPYELLNGAHKFVSKDDEKAVEKLSDKISEEYQQHKNDAAVAAGIGWYSKMRSFLQRRFGAGIEFFGQMLAATSAQTPVDQNFKQALEALKLYSQGKYDDLLQRYDAHVKSVDALTVDQLKAEWEAEGGKGKFDPVDYRRKKYNDFSDIPLRSNGKKYNANSQKVLHALYGNWLSQTVGPKTKNFAGNLTGRSTEATIDVWAARFLRRMIYQGKQKQWRITPQQEGPVKMTLRVDGSMGGDYPFAEKVFRRAADKIGIEADDLQAFMWYLEKDVWDKEGWTRSSVAKAKSSFEGEAEKLNTERFQAGATTFRDEASFSKEKQEAARKSIQDAVRGVDGIVLARVTHTNGEYSYKGDVTREPSFDIEFTVNKGADVSKVVETIKQVGREHGQHSVMISRVVDADHPNARPAVEIGLKTPVPQSETIDAIKNALYGKMDVGFTIARDNHGNILGIRSQFVPEFSEGDAREGAAKFAQAVKELKAEFGRHPDISYFEPSFVDTKVEFTNGESTTETEPDGGSSAGERSIPGHEEAGRSDLQGDILPGQTDTGSGDIGRGDVFGSGKAEGDVLGPQRGPQLKKKATVEEKLVDATKENIRNWMASGQSKESISDRLIQTLRVDKETADALIYDAQNNFKSDPVVSNPSSIKSVISAGTDSRNRNSIVMGEMEALKKQIKDRAAGFAQGFKQGAKDQKAIQQGMKSTLDFMRGNIEGILKRAVDTGMMDGKTSARIAASILRSVNKANTPIKLMRVFDKLNKYLSDVDYVRQLDEANSVKAALNKARKLKNWERSATNIGLIKEFLSLNPFEVSDLAAYKKISSAILHNVKGIKADLVPGEGIVVSGEEYKISNNEIEQYLNDQKAFIEEAKKQKLAETYQDLVDMGVIDPATMSLDEMRDILSSIDDAGDSISKPEIDAQKLEALREVVSYGKEALQDYADGNIGNGTLSAEQERVLKGLTEVNVEDLTSKQLAKYNDVINNVLYNASFTGAGDLANFSAMKQGVAKTREAIEESGTRLGSLRDKAARALSTVPLMTEFIAKSSKLASQIQAHTGIGDIFNGHIRAKLRQHKTLQEFLKARRKIKGADDPLNRYRRGVYARVIQHYGGDAADLKTEFERVKGLIRQSADRLLGSSNKAERREGELIEKVFNELLDGAESVADVESRMDQGNKDLVKFWMDKFEEIREPLRESSEIYNNKLFEEAANYTATEMKRVDRGSMDTGREDIFDPSFISRSVNTKPANTKVTRMTSPSLPTSEGGEVLRVLNLDFDAVQNKRYYESLYDIENGKTLSKVRMFFKDRASAEVLGSAHNRNIVMRRIVDSVNLQRGTSQNTDVYGVAVEKVLNSTAVKAGRMALGSVSQLVKQSVPVALGTVVNLGRDADLFFRALSNASELMEQFTIGDRGATKAGLLKDVNFETVDPADFSNPLSAAARSIDKAVMTVTDAIMKPLTLSDTAIARLSWKAYYLQYLRRQGKPVNVNWSSESANPDREAAAYAEQMVARNQNVSDASQMPGFYQLKGWGAIIKNLVMPFSSFSTNMRVKMTNDLQKILFGGNKTEAVKSLVGTLAEQAAFNAIKGYIISAVIQAGFGSVAKALQVWDEDDEEASDAYSNVDVTIGGNTLHTTDKTKKVVANTVSDFFFSGLGSATQEWSNDAMNYLYGQVAKEYYPNNDREEDKPALFYRYDPARYDKPDFRRYGLYGSAAEAAYNLGAGNKAVLERAFLGRTDEWFKDSDTGEYFTEKADITPEQRKAYLYAWIVDALGFAGLSESDLLQINRKLNNHLDKQILMEFGGGKKNDRYISSRADEEETTTEEGDSE